MIEKWRVEYNTRRPHSALGYRPCGTCDARAANGDSLGRLRLPARLAICTRAR